MANIPGGQDGVQNIPGGQNGAVPNNNSNWVEQIEARIHAAAAQPVAPPSIYQVPAWMKGTRSSEAYEPQVVSLGPFHYGRHKAMEEYKKQAMQCLVDRSRKTVQAFVDATAAVEKQLEMAYVGLRDHSSWHRWLNDGATFVEMMATDGCFLLEMALRVYDAQPGPRAPGFGGAPRDTQALFMWQSILNDVVAIENQLPLFLLKELERVRTGTVVTDEWINKLVLGFFAAPRDTDVPQVLALHPLDIFYKSFCVSINPRGAPQYQVLHNTMPCALELSQAGIVFKKSTTRKLDDIDFIKRCCKRPVLQMPVFRVRNDTERHLLNLVAYEQLHAGAGHVITSYLRFMDNIIDTEADVARLRSAGVIVHTLGSDQAVANLFNNVYKGPLSPESHVHTVQREVMAHINKKCSCAKFWALLIETCARNALVIISTAAAVILFILTLLQTIYTMKPYYEAKS